MTKLHKKRMQRFVSAGIYLVTSQTMSMGRSTVEIVRAALAGGVRLIQLREKELSTTAFMDLACKIRAMTKKAGALLLINDRLDVALAVNADGVHLGQDDFSVKEARKLAPDLIIGASSHSPKQAAKAQKDGASYVNIGPIFPTKTKKWTGEFLGIDGLKKISSKISIPFTVMGGIKKEHIPQLVSAGARTIAVVTAITAAKNPEKAARELLKLVNRNGGRYLGGVKWSQYQSENR